MTKNSDNENTSYFLITAEAAVVVVVDVVAAAAAAGIAVSFAHLAVFELWKIQGN